MHCEEGSVHGWLVCTTKAWNYCLEIIYLFVEAQDIIQRELRMIYRALCEMATATVHRVIMLKSAQHLLHLQCLFVYPGVSLLDAFRHVLG